MNSTKHHRTQTKNITDTQRAFGFVIVCVLIGMNIGHAQELQRQKVIAAYLYNFAKNVQWQDEERLKEFHFRLITEDRTLINEMTLLAKTKTIRNKPIVVSSDRSLDIKNSVQLVFIGNDQNESMVKVFDAVEGKNTLLVSDGYTDKRIIMLNLIEGKDGNIRFEMNKANIINQHLMVMDDMVLLGGTEIDVADLYREGQQSLRTLQKHTQDLDQDVHQLEEVIAQQSSEIAIQKDSLTRQSERMKTQQNFLDAQLKQLNDHEVQLASQKQQMSRQQAILDSQSARLLRQTNELKAGNELLQDQKDRIASQQKVLEEKGTTITKQQNYLALLIIIIVLSILLVVALYRSYMQKQRVSEELERKVVERTNELSTINEQLQKELRERTRMEHSLQENMQKFRTLFEINPDAIFITDANTLQIYDCNQRACAMNGYTRDELVGQSINILHLEPTKEIVENLEGRKKFIALLHEKKSVTQESFHRRKDGTVFPIETSMCLLTLEGRDFVMGIDRDITERKRAEQELKKYHERLEEMVHERTTELKVAKERAESADQLKSAFLATMSHELRTPLNSIIGFTGILLRGIAGSLNDEQNKQLGMVKTSAQHLLELINDVLDISKIEAGELVVARSPFNYYATVKKVVATVQPLAEKKDIHIVLTNAEETLPMNSDERRVGQVLLNIINNAVKFTDRGFVKIDCQIHGSSVVTRITDTGIGIKKEDRDKLFKPFSQIDTGLTRTREGTGLGLSISQKLMDKLNGSISVESEEGKGSTFTVTFPI